ncbi:MAG: VWA domain-containing protein [bacterium]|nr:VWA domain-containing protein [bacterium]
MQENYTHISIILDRTGSMEGIRDDIIGGFNAFLKEQKEQPGKATLTLVQFDTQDPYEIIHSFRPIAEIPELTRKTYVPRASTPLLDAMGRGINDLEGKLAAIKEEEQPSKVIAVVVTDGQENSSREFSREQVKSMIEKKQEQDNWQFVFLSADLDAINDAVYTGIRRGSTLAFDKTSRGNAEAWSSLSGRIAECREDTGIDCFAFTDEDRAKQEAEKKRFSHSR